MKLSVLIYEYSSAKAYKINILNALHFTKKLDNMLELEFRRLKNKFRFAMLIWKIYLMIKSLDLFSNYLDCITKMSICTQINALSR